MTGRARLDAGLAAAGALLVAGALRQPADPDAGGLRFVLLGAAHVPRPLELALRLDPLAALAGCVALVLVAASAGARPRAAAAVAAGVLIAALADSLLVLWLGWVAVDAAAFPGETRRPPWARAGDLFLVGGMCAAAAAVGSLRFLDLGAAAYLDGPLARAVAGVPVAGWILAALVAGATARAAARPGAQAVVATAFACFLLLRLLPVLRLVPGFALALAWGGIAVAAVAGRRALVVAQTGFAIAAIGLGAPVAAVVHLLGAAALALAPTSSPPWRWAAAALPPFALALARARLEAEALTGHAALALAVAAATAVTATSAGRAAAARSTRAFAAAIGIALLAALGVLDLPGTLWRRADHDLLGAWLAPSFGQQVDASASRLVLGLVLTTAAGAAGLVWARRRQWAASHASAQATPPAAAASATAVR